MTNPHLLDKEIVLRKLSSDTDSGLSTPEAKLRLGHYGLNELVEKGKRSALSILFAQLTEIMVLILFIAAVISFFLHEYIDAVVIALIVVLNTVIGFWQEYKAETAMSALKKLAVPNVRVRRDGRVQEITAKELVPGDIILVEAGNFVPADARLLEPVNLKVQESSLTGESEPVLKSGEALSGDDVSLGDRENMIFMGTVVTYGRAKAVVTATGMDTELGNIATMMQEMEEEKTPLQIRLAKLGKTLASLALVLIVIVAGLSLLRGIGLKETFMTAISMAVAAIPEGLPAVVTIALALGAQRMLGKKSLIRHLPAVETLGSVTVICSDKTGTLTQNKMTVTDVALPGTRFKMEEVISGPSVNDSVNLLLLAGTLCNDAELSTDKEKSEPRAIGDPTEGALVLAAHKLKFPKEEIETSLPRIAELPFDSERKRMTTVHEINAISDSRLNEVLSLIRQKEQPRYIAFTKGSVDGLLDICTHVLIDGAIKKFTDELQENVLDENRRMAENGIRVLGAAFRFLQPDETNDPAKFEEKLVYIGMTGMIDPVRPEAVDAVRQCQKAGIRVVMITGDHPLTARAIARELGILENGRYLTGRDLSKMSVKELKEIINEVRVFARVSPEHKMVIIDAMQEQNQIVSMTGDGVNDAPALKSADIGVAMGITGTDVARESSDMVLLDDNFATIVAAVKEGRTIFDNIRKFAKYILTGNAGEIFVMLVGPILGMPLPLLPIQILWINLVTDGLPAIALGYEESEPNVMSRPPYQPQEGIFSRGIGRQILTMGFIVGLLSVSIGFWFWELDRSNPAWQTMIFSSLTFSQIFYAMTVRKTQQSFFRTSPFSNHLMIGAVLITFALQLILIYVPFFNTIFRTVPLTGMQLSVCIGGAFIVMFFTEIEKFILRHRDVVRF